MKGQVQGWVFGLVLRTLPGTDASHRVFYVGFQLPATAHPKRQQVVPRVAGTLAPTGETQTEFLAPGFGLLQSGCHRF